MAHRLVSSEEAHSAKQAEQQVVADTGGACIPTGQTIEVSGGWLVTVFSSDGYGKAPDGSTGRSFFLVVSVEDGGVRLRDSHGYEFTVSRQSLDLDIVKPGQTLSAVQLHAGELTDAFNESEPMRERKQFNSVQSEGQAWTPGIATGDEFRKQ